MDNLWAKEEDALLARLWASKLSAGSIAEQFPTRSRNAVIGRAHRLNLPSRVSPIVKKKSVDWSAGRCKFIHGEPTANPTFCGKDVVNDSSWCKEHHKIVFKQSEKAV